MASTQNRYGYRHWSSKPPRVYTNQEIEVMGEKMQSIPQLEDEVRRRFCGPLDATDTLRLLQEALYYSVARIRAAIQMYQPEGTQRTVKYTETYDMFLAMEVMSANGIYGLGIAMELDIDLPSLLIHVNRNLYLGVRPWHWDKSFVGYGMFYDSCWEAIAIPRFIDDWWLAIPCHVPGHPDQSWVYSAFAGKEFEKTGRWWTTIEDIQTHVNHWRSMVAQPKPAPGMPRPPYSRTCGKLIGDRARHVSKRMEELRTLMQDNEQKLARQMSRLAMLEQMQIALTRRHAAEL